MLSLILAVAGGLFPLIGATGLKAPFAWEKWGYIVLAAAAGLFSADRVLGFSAEAIRNLLTWLDLRRALAKCDLDLISVDPEKRIELLRKLRLDAEGIIAHETDLWKDEVARQIAAWGDLVKHSPPRWYHDRAPRNTRAKGVKSKSD